MKENGFLADWIKASVEKKQRKYARKAPNLFTDQKNQIWYMLMNQLDGVPAEEAEAADGAQSPEGGSAPE